MSSWMKLFFSEVAFSLRGANFAGHDAAKLSYVTSMHTRMTQQFSAVLAELFSDNVYLILLIKICLMAKILKATLRVFIDLPLYSTKEKSWTYVKFYVCSVYETMQIRMVHFIK